MAERRRQAGGEGRGVGEANGQTYTHTNVQKYTQIETHMQRLRKICMGMYADTQNTNMLMKQPSQHTIIHIQIHNIL